MFVCPRGALPSVFDCLFPSIAHGGAGGDDSLVVEEGVQASQDSDRAELLPQRVPGPADPGS